MREIKYQAFIEKNIIEGYPSSIYQVRKIMFNEDGVLTAIELDLCDWIDIKWVTLREFTGLKDKNGKEIYEGDILERVDSSKVIIKWSQASHSFEWFSAKLPDRFWNSDAEDWQMSEVIGNIYENPNLVEGNNAR